MHSQISWSTWALLISLCCSAQAAPPRGVDLAALEGWDIVVSEEAIPSEAYAAEEFQHHVAAATGRTLPIVKSVDRPTRTSFESSPRACSSNWRSIRRRKTSR